MGERGGNIGERRVKEGGKKGERREKEGVKRGGKRGEQGGGKELPTVGKIKWGFRKGGLAIV